MTTFTRTWDEASPADTQNISLGATRMREIKADVRERLDVDHSHAGDVDDGMHKKVTFVDPLGVKPPQANDESYLYTKDVGGTSELFYEDEAGNEVQLTSAGANQAFDAGTSMLFYQSAAPTGWTKDTAGTLNDHALRIVTSTGWSSGSKGSIAFSTVFVRTATDSHVLVTNEIPAHGHVIDNSLLSKNYTGQAQTTSGTAFPAIQPQSGTNSTNNTGGGAGHTHNADMRVNYVNLIRATKD